MAKETEDTLEPSLTAEQLEATRTQPHPAQVKAAEKAALAKVSNVFGAELAPTALEIDLEEAGTSYADLAGGAIDLGEELGEYELVDKSDLIATPFVIVGVNLNETDLTNDEVYANVRCITKDGAKVCFNDGSTGVYTQLKRVLNNQPEPKPILVKGGLRVSVFHWDPKTQSITEGTPNAKVYYLSSSLKMSEKSKVAASAFGLV